MSRSSSEQRGRENHPRVFKKNLTEKRKYEENDVIKYHKAYFSSILLLERRAEIARRRRRRKGAERENFVERRNFVYERNNFLTVQTEV